MVISIFYVKIMEGYNRKEADKKERGFRYGKKGDFPVTLYKEDVRKLSQPTNRVLAIFVRDYKQQSYTKCTYLSKGQKVSKLQIHEEMKALIPVENIEFGDGNDECFSNEL